MSRIISIPAPGSVQVNPLPTIYTVLPGAVIPGSTLLAASYVTLIDPTTEETLAIEVINTSGKSLALAVGAMGSETIIAYISTEGLERQNIKIVIGERISVKSLDGDGDQGHVAINRFA